MSKNKNIIICSDGTANQGGQGFVTNVWRLFSSLDLNNETGAQIAIHDDGVGTEDLKYLRWITGAFGLGLKRNIRQLYTFLIRNYVPGDRIYIFGFSRGAYTARMLAELICVCGVVNQNKLKAGESLDDVVRESIEILRLQFRSKGLDPVRKLIDKTSVQEKIKDGSKGKQLSEKFVRSDEYIKSREEKFKEKYSFEFPPSHKEKLIKFVGVWDTVPAYGFPVDWLANFWNRFIYPYKFDEEEGSKLNQDIERAAHALAIDDQRKTFKPMLWDENGDKGQNKARIEQVWFPGMHASVGGGYPKDGLALLSLEWMVSKAQDAETTKNKKLRFNTEKLKAFESAANPYDRMYDSRSGIYVVYRYQPRDIEKLCENFCTDAVDNDFKIKVHASVLERARSNTKGYAPANLPGDFKLVGCPESTKEKKDQLNTLKEKYISEFPQHKTMLRSKGYVVLRRILHWIMSIGILGLVTLSILIDKGIINNTVFCGKAGIGNYIFKEHDNFLAKIMEIVPLGDWLFSNLIAPLIRCQSLFITLLILAFGVYAVGRVAKIAMKNRAKKFWQPLISKENKQ